MKTYSIKNNRSTKTCCEFEAPKWAEVKKFSMTFSNDCCQLAKSMANILRDKGVKVEFENRLLPTITLRYNDGDYPKFVFEKRGESVLVLKEDKDEYYTRG